MQAKSAGADIRMVYSPLDALELARATPRERLSSSASASRRPTPSTALSIQAAAREGLKNFSVFLQPHHRARTHRALLGDPDMVLDGFIGPGHVSMVIGTHPYDFVPQDFGKPIVVAGFEPTDLLQSVAHGPDPDRRGSARRWKTSMTRVVPEHGNPVFACRHRRCLRTPP